MLAVGVVLAGCDTAPSEFPMTPAEIFTSPGQEPLQLTLDQRRLVSERLRGLFGTPAEPTVPEELTRIPGFQKDRLVVGAREYRRLCLHCHGLTGDGAGPTAPFLFPRPRDYRPGIFKFTSTTTGAKPTWEDLHYTLVRGAAGTAMPSFQAYPEDVLNALVDYVIYLSARGQVERELAFVVAEYNELSDQDVQSAVARVAEEWAVAPNSVVEPESEKPPFTWESVRRGREYYLSSTKGNCAACHGDRGLGDGPSAVVDPATGQPMRDTWGFEIRPTDLTQGFFRGGRRPLDLYRRIHSGVKGTPMPGQAANLKPEEIWDVVHFVLWLPYQHEPASLH
jgi:mono/diheme cytochrome c family protein